MSGPRIRNRRKKHDEENSEESSTHSINSGNTDQNISTSKRSKSAGIKKHQANLDIFLEQGVRCDGQIHGTEKISGNTSEMPEELLRKLVNQAVESSNLESP